MDALNIVKGQQDAATQYFRQKTTEKLIAAFTPSIKNSLKRARQTLMNEMTSIWNEFIVRTVNRQTFTRFTTKITLLVCLLREYDLVDVRPRNH